MEVNLETNEVEQAKLTPRTMNLSEECNMAVDSTSNTINVDKSVMDSNASMVSTTSSSKTLKRCLSVPIIHILPGGIPSSMTTRSAAAAAAAVRQNNNIELGMGSDQLPETPKKYQQNTDNSTSSNTTQAVTGFGNSIHISIPRSNPCSREVSPAPVFNIFAPRARRYSASGVAAVNSSGTGSAPLCVTPRVSQLRQEECVDVNSREVNHEREVHSAMQMSQSWEDLTLVAENWSCKSDEFSNPLQVILPTSNTAISCSSPSPTSNRAGMRLPYGLSPSPTRRTFATRRSMSPIAMRPSQLGPVKRKFELDDNTSSNWNVYSPPPMKKIFTESRGSSPGSVCPSPDSGTYDGRITPKLFISKLCTTNTNNNNSACSSPMSSSPSSTPNVIDPATSSSSSSSSYNTSSIGGGSEPMCTNIDEGISLVVDEKLIPDIPVLPLPMSTDLQDEAIMDDTKSETSSIGGCSSISVESSSCDSGTKAAASFFNRLNVEERSSNLTLGQKQFFINKQGLSGAKKFVVNHDNLPKSRSSSISSGSGEQIFDNMNSSNETAQNPLNTTVVMVENKF